MANILGYYKLGNDVYENRGGGQANSYKLSQSEFQNLGINYNLLGEGLSMTKLLDQVRDTETKKYVEDGGVLGKDSAAVKSGYTYDVGKNLVTTSKNPIGGSDEIAKDVQSKNDEITKALADLGIEQPTDEISETVQKILDDLNKRQLELDKRREEDLAGIEKSYAAAGEEQDIQQEEALAKAEGRTRIGGFITKMEIQDIQNLQRKFRLEDISLQGQKATALQTAQRAYADQDFELAQAQLEVARDAEKQAYERKQDYFNNVIKMQEYYEKLNKPINQANEADQAQMLAWMEDAPSIIKTLGLKPSDILLGNVKYGEIMAAYFDSPEYEKSLKDTPKKVSDPNPNNGGGNFTNTQINTGAANAGVNIADFKKYDEDTKNFFVYTVKNAKGILDENIENGSSNEELHNDINAQAVSQIVKDYLNAYVDKQLPPEEEEEDEDGGFKWWDPRTWW